MIKVSVVIPTYNRPSFLRQALQSVLRQTYQNFEIIVVNDCGESVKTEIDRFGDSRIKYIENKKNLGLAGARNIGIENAVGKHICFLDDDDNFYKNHISILVEGIEKYKDYAGVYTDANQIFLDETGKTLYSKVHFSLDWEKDFFLIGNHIHVLSYIIKKKVIVDIGKFDERMVSGLEDYDLLLRLSRNNSLKHIPVTTSEYIRHKGSSLLFNKVQYKNCLKYFYTKHEQIFDSIKDREKLREKYFHSIFKSKFSEYIKDLKSKKLVIWGAGEGGQLYYKFLQENNFDIEFFLDINAKNINSYLYNKKIFTPDYFFQEFKPNDEYYIFIAVSFLKNIFEIFEYLLKRNFNNFRLVL